MIRVATLSLQGKRPSNQDRILIAPEHFEGSGRIVAAVADGLGGMQAGDKAAEIAVDALNQAADELLLKISGEFEDARASLVDVYQRANDRIRTYAEEHVRPGAVGTTLVTLIVSGSRYLVANAGDSRCYAVNGAGVEQLTQDHTVADSLLRHGVMAAKDYPSSPLRNQLTRSLGPKPECEPDIFPEVEFGAIDRGCTFLLCSDGFYSKLTDADLWELASRSSIGGPSLDEVLERLAAEALGRQSSDNLSAIAVRLEL